MCVLFTFSPNKYIARDTFEKIYFKIRIESVLRLFVAVIVVVGYLLLLFHFKFYFWLINNLICEFFFVCETYFSQRDFL